MYKAFQDGIVNRYNEKYELGKIYKTDGDIKFGTKGNGFHMCKRIEDTFRYYDFMESNSIVTEVIGIGDFKEYEDEYNGYYDMYAYEAIKILRVLTREEILKYFNTLSFSVQIERFLMTYKFTIEEIYIIKEKLISFLKYSYMKNYLDNYQDVSYQKLLRM